MVRSVSRGRASAPDFRREGVAAALRLRDAPRTPATEGEGRSYADRADAGIAALRLIGFAGWSGAGKTTLLARIIPLLRARGLSVSTIKHAHHGFDVDRPGKDSHRHREAGASQVLVASPHRWALMTEHRGAPEPGLDELLRHLSPVDVVVVEGFKRDPIPKIEVHRAANGKAWIHPEDPDIRAVASDVQPDSGLPWAALDDAEAVADLVLRHAAPLGVAGRLSAG